MTQERPPSDEFAPDEGARDIGDQDAGSHEIDDAATRRARAVAIADRSLAGASGFFGVVVVILFFLPWAAVSCGSMRLARQSGFQAAAGRIENLQDLEKSKDGSPKADEMGFPSDGSASWKQSSEDVSADWPLFAVPVAAAFAIGAGVARFLPRGRRTSPLVPTALLGIALTVIVVYLFVGIGIQREFDKGMGEMKAKPDSSQSEGEASVKLDQGMESMMKEMIQCKRSEAFAWTVVCLVLAFGSSLARRFLPESARHD